MIGSDLKADFKDIWQLLFSRHIMLHLFMCIVWAIDLLSVLRGIVSHLPGLSELADTVVIIVTLVLLLFSLPTIINRFTLADYCFYFFWVFLYLLNFLFYPENSQALTEDAYFCLCSVFPCYFIGRIFEPKKYLCLFSYVAVFLIIWKIFYFVIYFQMAKNAREMTTVNWEDNMYAGYSILPHVLLLMLSIQKQFSLLKFVFILLGIVAIVSFGSRGPLACLAFFMIMNFIFMMKFKYSLIVKCACVTLGVVMLVFMKEIALTFKMLFESANLSTRIIDRIIGGGLTHDTGRSWISNKLYTLLDNSENFFGMGFFGSQRFSILYAHNFLCDVFFTFGYIPGAILLFLFVSLVVSGFVLSRDFYEKGFVLVLICTSVIKLFVSSTFLYEPLFFMLIGVCVSIVGRYFSTCHSKPVLYVNQ